MKKETKIKVNIIFNIALGLIIIYSAALLAGWMLGNPLYHFEEAMHIIKSPFLSKDAVAACSGFALAEPDSLNYIHLKILGYAVTWSLIIAPIIALPSLVYHLKKVSAEQSI